MEEPVGGDKPPKKRRGPGKKPPMLCTSLRLPKEVMEYFDQFPNKQTRMREVLTEFVKRQQGNYDE
jgi:uncharacterized protein (DUF4415 family)